MRRVWTPMRAAMRCGASIRSCTTNHSTFRSGRRPISGWCTGTISSSRISTCRAERSKSPIGWSTGSIPRRKPRSRKPNAPTRPIPSIKTSTRTSTTSANDFSNSSQNNSVVWRKGAHLPLLEIDNLKVAFDTEAGLVQAVDGVSLTLDKGRTLGLVGESGCGKSVTATSILRLVPSPPGKILGGHIRFNGVDLLALPREDLPKIRGKDIAMIFQDPMTSLNPIFTVEKQLGEVLKLRFGMDKEAARARSTEMLATVGIPDPATRLTNYPHELSGGQKQRVMIAMALLTQPQLLIADEPTTAL